MKPSKKKQIKKLRTQNLHYFLFCSVFTLALFFLVYIYIPLNPPYDTGLFIGLIISITGLISLYLFNENMINACED